MSEPTERDRTLINDASNMLQVSTHRLLPPTPRRLVAQVLPFVDLPNRAVLDDVTRTYRDLALQELTRNGPGITYHDPDLTAFRLVQGEAMEKLADAVIRAAQEDRFS